MYPITSRMIPPTMRTPVLFEGNEVGDECDPKAATMLLTISQDAALTPITRRVPHTVFQGTPDAEDANRSIGAARENPMTAPSKK